MAPLVLFEKSRLWAGTGFHLLPSFLHRYHATQHNYTTQTVTHTVTLTSTSYNTIQILFTCNVVCPRGTWFENRPHSTPSILLVRNPKRVIVQWVGIGTHTHTQTHTHTHTHTHCRCIHTFTALYWLRITSQTMSYYCKIVIFYPLYKLLEFVSNLFESPCILLQYLLYDHSAINNRK